MFEHFIFLELKHDQLTNRFDWEIEFWRTHSQDEVDFVLGTGEVLIEGKASDKIKLEHMSGINKFCKDYKYKKAIIVYIVYMGDVRKKETDVGR